MKSTRSEFLRLAMMTGTAAVVAPRLAAKLAVPGAGANDAIAAGPAPEKIRAVADPVFWILGPTGRPQTKLLLERIADDPSCCRTRQFSMIFTCPDGARLPEKAYPLSHSELGRVEFHLQPSAPGDDPRIRYRAVFNLLNGT